LLALPVAFTAICLQKLKGGDGEKPKKETLMMIPDKRLNEIHILLVQYLLQQYRQMDRSFRDVSSTEARM
jgi:hypothetical protein